MDLPLPTVLPFLVGVFIGGAAAWWFRSRRADGEAARFRSDVAAARADGERRRGEYETLKADFDRRALEFATVKAENSGLRDEAEKARERIAALADDTAARDMDAEGLRAEIAKWRAACATAASETDRVRAEVARLQEEIVRRNAALDELGADTDRLRADWESLRQENARLRGEPGRPPAPPAPTVAASPAKLPTPPVVTPPTPPAKPEVAPVASPTTTKGFPPRRGDDEDDLEAISGIGPSLHRQLREIGLVTYRQIALLDPATIATVGTPLLAVKGRFLRENWQEQARARHREKYAEEI